LANIYKQVITINPLANAINKDKKVPIVTTFLKSIKLNNKNIKITIKKK